MRVSCLYEFILLLWGSRRGSCHILLIGQSVQFANKLKMKQERDTNKPGRIELFIFLRCPTW